MQFAAIPKYFKRADVKAALHLPEENGAVFDYDTSGPASVTLYPDLIKSSLRVLIYNGDADTCVPYVGNQVIVYYIRMNMAAFEKDPLPI